MKHTIRIGTRGSQLALYQANRVKDELTAAHTDFAFEIKIIKTKGDKILDVPLAKIGDKGVFTKEIEDQLIEGSVDMAVHSLKDLPTLLPVGLILGAILERGEVRDALVTLTGKKLIDLNEKDKIATSSLRRRAGLLYINPSFRIVDIRGNVNTRILKMQEGYCSAMIMASAGLQRLQLDSYITEFISPDSIMPAVGQGAIAVEIRAGDSSIKEICNAINHKPTELSVRAERAFMHHLEGGCQVPIGAYSQLINGTLEIRGFVATTDGTNYITSQVSGDSSFPEQIGIELANALKSKGAVEILKAIRSQSGIQ